MAKKEIKEKAMQNDIALKIDTALHNIEKNNKALNVFKELGYEIKL